MPVRKYRPTSPGRRFQSVSTFEEVTKKTPEKSLLVSLRQTGGRNAVARTLFLGFMAGGSGTYELRGGTLTAGNIYVGGPGTGTFNQSGGTSTVTETLFVGGTDPGSGTFNMSWGALQAGNIVIMSSGAFNINGGSVVAPDRSARFAWGLELRVAEERQLR